MSLIQRVMDSTIGKYTYTTSLIITGKKSMAQKGLYDASINTIGYIFANAVYIL